MSVSSVKNLNGESFTAVQDAELTDIVSNNSASWNEASAISDKLDESAFSTVSGDYATTADLNNYVPLTGIIDTIDHQFAKLGTYNLSFSSEYSNISSFGSYSNYSIDNYIRSANVPGYAAQLWLSNTGLYLNQTSAYGSSNSGYVDLNRNGLNLRSVNGEAEIGPNYDLLRVYKSGNNTSPSFIGFNIGSGPSYSSENTAIGQFYVYIWSDINVPRNNPVWVVKNGSGDGFSIGASEAKGFDKDGNTIWSTKMSKATQLIHGGTDPNPAILLTPMQTTTAYTAQWSSAPYVSASYDSLSISYGPTANVPNIKLTPEGLAANYTSSHASYTTTDATISRYTAYNDPNRIDWSLTGSVQKREIEGDTATSAITAIAGSAVGTYNETVLFDGVISSNETAMLSEPASAFERIKVYGYLDSDLENQYYPWYTEFTTNSGYIRAGAWTNDPFEMCCFCFIIDPSAGFINATGRSCAFGLTAWDVIHNWATTKVIGINRKPVVAEEQTEE